MMIGASVVKEYNSNEDNIGRTSSSSSSLSLSQHPSAFPSVTTPKSFLQTFWNRLTFSNLIVLRVIFLSSVIFAAVVMGMGTKIMLTRQEEHLAASLFNSKANNTRELARDIFQRGRLTSRALALIISHAHPNASEWPFVHFIGFEPISTQLFELTWNMGAVLMPFVRSEQVESFEKFYYDYFATKFPEGAGTSSFGKGIWSQDFAISDAPDGRFHDTGTGDEATCDSRSNSSSAYKTHKLLAPIVQQSSGNHPVLMSNARHFLPEIDDVLKCAADRALTNDLNIECDEFSDFFQKLSTVKSSTGSYEYVLSIAAISPIYPVNDPFTIVGLVTAGMEWTIVLHSLLTSSGMSDVECVVSSLSASHTFLMTKKEVVYLGAGDLHNTAYSQHGLSIDLTPTAQIRGFLKTRFTLSLYPTEAFFEQHRTTSNPTVASITVVSGMAVLLVIFSLYDYVVQKEFGVNAIILDSKKRFVRFISHEVRTPLNTVFLGLRLLEEDIRKVSAEQLASRQGPALAPSHAMTIATTAITPTSASSMNLTQKLEDWGELSQEVMLSASNAVNVLTDLLSFDKIETDSVKLELSVLPIWRLIEESLEEFCLHAYKNKIKFALEFDHSLLPAKQRSREDEQGNADDVVAHARLAAVSSHGRKMDSSKPPSLSAKATLQRNSGGSDDLRSDVLLLKAVGDRVKIIQVIRNLVSNAFKFTPEGGRLTVRVAFSPELSSRSIKDSVSPAPIISGMRDNKYSDTEVSGVVGPQRKAFTLYGGGEVMCTAAGVMRLTVQDSGAGMTKQQVDALFREGVQFNVNELQAGQGSGLGLYIAKGFAESHGGSLEATSEGLGLGSIFTLTLPLYNILEELPTKLASPLPVPTTVEKDSATVAPAVNSSSNATVAVSKTSIQATAHEASMSAASTEAQPQYRMSNSSAAAATTNAIATVSSTTRRHLRVLCVDDSVPSRKMLTRLLKSKSHIVTEAGDGQETLDIVLSKQTEGRQPGSTDSSANANDSSSAAESVNSKFDCILMDFEMPVMNGPTATKALRAAGYTGLIVGITGNVLPEDKLYFLQCGADSVMSKPLNFSELTKLWGERFM